MEKVTHLVFTNDDGVEEKREITDAEARSLIAQQELKIAKLEDVDDEFEGGPILLNTRQENSLYIGRNIETLLADEIEESYANAWELIKAKTVAAATQGKAAYDGLRIGDYIDVPIESDYLRYEIGGFDWDKGCAGTIQGCSILFVTHTAWQEFVKWNPTNDNNGTAAQPFPYLASNVYSYLINTLLPKFPAEVRAVMKDRYALLESRYNASSKLTDSTTWDWKNIGRLWLPSEIEVHGRIQFGSRYGDGEGSQIPNFKNPSDRIFRTPEGERSHVWMRDVSGVSAANACIAGNYGYASTSATSNASIRVAPCFLVG